MRYVVSVLLLLASIVSLGLGVAQRTIWKPPSQITSLYTVPSGNSVRTVVIPNAALQAHSSAVGSPTLDVQGKGTIVAVSGLTSDIRAFIGSSTAVWIADNADGNDLHGVVRGADDTMPNPLGSDLWRAQSSSTSPLSIPTHRQDGLDLMVSTASASGRLSVVALTWSMANTNTPFALPLFIGGVTFFVAGAVWYFLALRVGRRKRRPKRHTKQRRRTA